MDGLHLTGNLIAHSSAFLVSLLLFVLTLRAARLPGTPGANVGFAVCAVLWTGGGLALTTASALGFDTFRPRALQYTAALAVLVPVLAGWGARRLATVAATAGALSAGLVWSRAVDLATLRPILTYYAAGLLILGFWSLWKRGTARVVLLPSLIIVTAGIAAAAMQTVWVSGTAYFLLTHLILLAVLCGFFLFARFRYADTFVRYSVRIILAGTLAASFLSMTESRVLANMAGHGHSATSFHVFAMLLAANTVLLTLTFLDDAISRRVIRWLFRAPDYEAEEAKLTARLSGLHDERDLAAALEETARRSLELASASVEAPGDEARHDEVLVPIYADGKLRQVLRVAPGPTKPGLVSRDLLYLRDLATQYGNRLDALSREREAADRQSREATLVQQVTEAELRALRAQVNPHFLFNSLNTIADLTVRDPARAETMTVRLAAVFRHVLAHSARPLTTVRDELAFLRTYLYIEEVRFGDRLQVSIEAVPEVEGAPIPSLILQPLVENALKHGLGPKPGPGHLWIRAEQDGGDVRLTVEDDGIGMRPPREGQGVGLANIADRLRTLYPERASVTLEAREGGGTIATVRIPKEAL